MRKHTPHCLRLAAADAAAAVRAARLCTRQPALLQTDADVADLHSPAMLQGYCPLLMYRVLLLCAAANLPHQHLACVASHQQHISSTNRQQGYAARLICVKVNRTCHLQLQRLL
jgi:hypothetical protein